MKNKIVSYYIISLLSISTMMPMACRGQNNHKDLSTWQDSDCTFYDWKKACDALPYFDWTDNPHKTGLREHMFVDSSSKCNIH